MKIMFAVPSYWPSQDGVATITRYLAEGLAKRGHEILIYTSAGNGGLQILPEQECHEGAAIERTRVYVRWPLRMKGRDDKSTRKRYYERVCSFAPDVLIVVCAQTWTLDWIAPYLDRLPCAKVFYSHGYSRLENKGRMWEQAKRRNVLGVYENWKINRYYRKLYRVIEKFDLAIYLSELNNSYRYSEEHGLTNGKVLENAIEDVFFDAGIKHVYDANTQNMLQAGDSIDYLFVANYNENKNHEMLIDAFAKADIGKSNLIFVGFEANEYSNALQIYSDKLMTGQTGKRVVYNVHLDREEIIDLYRTSNVFVCASKSETWSIVAHEAAACAIPIISTDVGVYSEIEGAIIVHSTEEMKEAIEKTYHNYDVRRWHGEAAYRWLKNKGCRVKDKVDWLEVELKKMCTEGTIASE